MRRYVWRHVRRNSAFRALIELLQDLLSVRPRPADDPAASAAAAASDSSSGRKSSSADRTDLVFGAAIVVGIVNS